MAIVLLPTPQDGYPNDTIRVSLDGASYLLNWFWNQREGVWALSISDADAQPILSGVRVALNVDLLDGCADSRRPPGRIFAIDPTGANVEPDLDTLGTTVRVVYMDAEEVAA